LPSFVIALLLAAHGLLHASFVSPAPPATAGGPQWPFDLAHSRLLSPAGLGASATRAIGIALLAVVLAGYLAAALSVVGILPGSLFVPAVVAGSVASAAMLVVFFHRWLVFGLLIDAVLLWAVLVTGWLPGEAGL
jgi:hypothetical protein